MSAAAAVLERPAAHPPCPQPVLLPATDANTVAALRARGIRVYPDLSRGTGLEVVDPFSAGWADFASTLRARRQELFLFTLGSYWPQEAGLLAAFARQGSRGIARAIRRCLDLRGAWQEEVWTRALMDRFVRTCLDQAARFPELYVYLGRGSCPHSPVFALNEEVAYTILEKGGTVQDALTALADRNTRHHLEFTADQLLDQVQSAAYLVTAPDAGYAGLLRGVLARRVI